MSATMVIFTRELREKSRLFLACLVLAAVPFLATLLPSARGHRGDVIAIVGGTLAVCIGLGVALSMGNSAISRDLAERRMSFYFAKPVRPGALWLGKAAASLVTALFCFGVIAVPAMLFAGASWNRRWLGGMQPLLVGALAIAVFFFVMHALATVTRSRSPLLALDFLFLILTAGALVMIVWPVVLGGAFEVSKVLAIAIAVAFLLVLAIAPIWQLEHGRTDIRRSHAAFSRFFWPAVGVVLLLSGGYVWWLVSAKPSDLDEIVSVEQPANGTSVMIAGTSRGRGDYQSSFLIDRTTGRYERLAAPPWWGIDSSRDGKVIAWLQPAGIFSVRQLELYAGGRATGILVSPSSHIVLSDDGTRVAADTGRMISVYEVATGKLLGSAAGFDPSSQASLFFVNNDLLRIIETSPLRIAELDLRARRLTRTGERVLETPRRRVISVSGDAARMFVQGPNLIVDGRTGATLAAIEPRRFVSASMLHDGSVAGVTVDNGTHLRLYAPDGTPRHALALPGERMVWVAGETESGKLILAARGGSMYVVDAATGTIAQKRDGLRGPFPPPSADPRLTRYGAGQELVSRAVNDELVVWKPEGGAPVRPLL